MSTSTLSVQQQLDEHAAQTAAKVSDDVKQAMENAGGQLETWLGKQDVLGVGDSVPATYVINREAKITYAFVNADYRKRAEPSDVLASLKD